MKHIDQLFAKHSNRQLAKILQERETEFMNEIKRFDSTNFKPQSELEEAIYYYMRTNLITYHELARYRQHP